MTPADNIGKITLALEKYYDVRTGRMDVKQRPVLIIGHENTYKNPLNVDYEVIPFGRLQRIEPDPNYDLLIPQRDTGLYHLNSECHLRTHKTSWVHSKNLRLEVPLCNLKTVNYDLFVEAVQLNYQSIYSRTCGVLPNFGT